MLKKVNLFLELPHLRPKKSWQIEATLVDRISSFELYAALILNCFVPSGQLVHYQVYFAGKNALQNGILAKKVPEH